MKSFLLSTTFLFAVHAMLQAQQVKVPEVVEQSFESRYPHAIEEQWVKKNNRFEVNFSLNGKQMKSCFGADGSWNHTCRLIKQNELPQDVQAAIQKTSNAGWTIYEIYEWQNAGKPLEYHITFQRAGEKKEMTITALGQKISK